MTGGRYAYQLESGKGSIRESRIFGRRDDSALRRDLSGVPPLRKRELCTRLQEWEGGGLSEKKRPRGHRAAEGGEGSGMEGSS